LYYNYRFLETSKGGDKKEPFQKIHYSIYSLKWKKPLKYILESQDLSVIMVFPPCSSLIPIIWHKHLTVILSQLYFFFINLILQAIRPLWYYYFFYSITEITFLHPRKRSFAWSRHGLHEVHIKTCLRCITQYPVSITHYIVRDWLIAF
jgi:hypothetical protein